MFFPYDAGRVAALSKDGTSGARIYTGACRCREPREGDSVDLKGLLCPSFKDWPEKTSFIAHNTFCLLGVFKGCQALCI
jgi:hypothetical protein